MQNVYCKVREDFISDVHKNTVPVYGVDAFDEAGRVVKSIPDIFFEKEKAESFVALCNSSNLQPIHLADVVADTLTAQYAAF